MERDNVPISPRNMWANDEPNFDGVIKGITKYGSKSISHVLKEFYLKCPNLIDRWWDPNRKRDMLYHIKNWDALKKDAPPVSGSVADTPSIPITTAYSSDSQAAVDAKRAALEAAAGAARLFYQ
jgi:hypothetical protein